MPDRPSAFADQYPNLNPKRMKRLLGHKLVMAYNSIRLLAGKNKKYEKDLQLLWSAVSKALKNEGYSFDEVVAANLILAELITAPE